MASLHTCVYGSNINKTIYFSYNNKNTQLKLPSTSSFTETKTPFVSFPIKTRLRTKKMALTTVNAAADSSTAVTIEKAGIKIVRNPPESKLTELGVRGWSKWGCPPSKFPWTYSATETCFLLQGKVIVKPDGTNEAVEIGAGDLVVFPEGMSCTWDVSVAVDKHYKFD